MRGGENLAAAVGHWALGMGHGELGRQAIAPGENLAAADWV